MTGERLFAVESGIIATWVRNVRDGHLTECVPYDPALVGQAPPRIVLGKGSGMDNIIEHLEAIGVEATEEQRLVLLERVKARSLAKRDLLTREEFEELARDVISG